MTDRHHDPYAALRFSEFRNLVLSSFLLTIALMMQEVAIGYELYRITHDPLALGVDRTRGGSSIHFVFAVWRAHCGPLQQTKNPFMERCLPSPSVQQSSSSFHENKILSLQRYCCSLFTRRFLSSVSAGRSSLPRRHRSADSSFPSNIMKTPQRGAVRHGR